MNPPLRWRKATLDDAPCLAAMNLLLIQDEEHRNPMQLAELEQRMRGWLAAEYEAVFFECEARPIA